jgi:hypothetical protein
MEADRSELVAGLRAAGARFAYLFGSQVDGGATDDSDVDVAAWWGSDPPDAWAVDLGEGVDLLVLDTAPLELAGRVAAGGHLLFEDDPPARVTWEAGTRKIWFDERARTDDARRTALDAMVARGRR